MFVQTEKKDWSCVRIFFFFQAEDGIRDVERSRGLGDVYKRQPQNMMKEENSLNPKISSQIRQSGNLPKIPDNLGIPQDLQNTFEMPVVFQTLRKVRKSSLDFCHSNSPKEENAFLISEEKPQPKLKKAGYEYGICTKRMRKSGLNAKASLVLQLSRMGISRELIERVLFNTDVEQAEESMEYIFRSPEGKWNHKFVRAEELAPREKFCLACQQRNEIVLHLTETGLTRQMPQVTSAEIPTPILRKMDQ
eukprot:TRINITY_DN8821_c0_g1_i1.p1 TRINITY_DN8821_c0_g1~~TRINITY_DN8821_c0_g1_i1.p1  ORF type:complete len:249 (-),score=42.04 TRINITY_DN8821_c0_g1_i1:115-861(-)